MSNSLLNKYLAKKKKDLLDYAKIIETLIKLDNNTLWSKKEEFINYAKEVIDRYVDTFYFDNNIHRDNPIEYANDNINSVLKSLISYCNETKQTILLQEKKNETFLLSVILTTSAYIDISTNVVDGNYLDTKAKFKYLLEYYKNTNILKVYVNNAKTVSKIFETVRKKRSKEEKFFNSFDSDAVYIDYIPQNNYYFTKFKYNIEGIDSYDEELVKQVTDEYHNRLLKIFMELLELKVIKELVTNNEVNNYLVVVNDDNEIFDDIRNTILNNYIKIVIKNN